MGVVNLPGGKPDHIALTGGAKARLDSMVPAGMSAGDPRDHHR